MKMQMELSLISILFISILFPHSNSNKDGPGIIENFGRS